MGTTFRSGSLVVKDEVRLKVLVETWRRIINTFRQYPIVFIITACLFHLIPRYVLYHPGRLMSHRFIPDFNHFLMLCHHVYNLIFILSHISIQVMHVCNGFTFGLWV